jgi:hypothetical protein
MAVTRTGMGAEGVLQNSASFPGSATRSRDDRIGTRSAKRLWLPTTARHEQPSVIGPEVALLAAKGHEHDLPPARPAVRRNALSRRKTWRSRAREEPRLHADRHRLARIGHRRQRGHVQLRRCAAATPASRGGFRQCRHSRVAEPSIRSAVHFALRVLSRLRRPSQPRRDVLRHHGFARPTRALQGGSRGGDRSAHGAGRVRRFLSGARRWGGGSGARSARTKPRYRCAMPSRS